VPPFAQQTHGVAQTTPAPARELASLLTPAAVVDLDRMDANLDRMAAYTKQHGLALRPHTKTHKSGRLGAEQVRRGAVGLTVAQLNEAYVMSGASPDILLAYPPVGRARLARLLALPHDVRVTVGLDSEEALRELATAAAATGREVGVLVELDLGMHRVGLPDPAAAAELSRLGTQLEGVAWRGVMFYPGHIRQHVTEQDDAIAAVNSELARFLNALDAVGLKPDVVSAGSTPAAFASHRFDGVNEVRPGTYIFNDRTTALIGACAWEDCAYSVLATVVSTAVAGQAVVDAGAKALFREELRGSSATGFGALLDRPDVVVSGMSEEHGLLDLRATSWRPRVGDLVRIVPNHVCVSVNLHDTVWGVRGDDVESSWRVDARGWDPWAGGRHTTA
jgi:D-serine deaminase-like pyridoxal phosphate-dependent protein